MRTAVTGADPWPFGATYSESRSLFLAACAAKDVFTATYPYRAGPGLFGENDQSAQIACDVAYFGDPAAETLLIVNSATHGAEGGCGSGLQTAWIQSGLGEELPETVGVLMIHALNPWGFAHLARTTEENVDLNRNFVDFAQKPAPNKAYNRFHPMAVPVDWSAKTEARLRDQIKSFRAEIGEAAFQNAMRAGQYDHPSGIGYGGAAPTWSRRLMEHLLGLYAAHRRQVAFIDLHTGIGPVGERTYLCFHGRGSSALTRAASWWGDAVLAGSADNEAGLTAYRGLLFEGITPIIPDVDLTVLCVEFGTTGFEEVQLAISADVWRRTCREKSAADDRRAADLIQRSFFPLDRAWQVQVLPLGLETIAQAIEGLAAT